MNYTKYKKRKIHQQRRKQNAEKLKDTQIAQKHTENTGKLTRKASCRWQTRATLAKRLHGLRKSSGVVSCIARLPIDSLPMVSY